MLGNDWTSRQWRKAMVEQYPYLLPRDYITDEPFANFGYTYVVGELDLPEGWFDLFLQCCEDIKEPLAKADRLDRFRFIQIKEKWGSMRLYAKGATEEVLNILHKYEFLSQQVCCVCGEPAAYQTLSYICPFCSEHIDEYRVTKEDCVKLTPKTKYTYRHWTSNGVEIPELDCSSEWNRYLKSIDWEDTANA